MIPRFCKANSPTRTWIITPNKLPPLPNYSRRGSNIPQISKPKVLASRSHSLDDFLEDVKSPSHFNETTKSCNEIDTKSENFESANSDDFLEHVQPPADLKKDQIHQILSTRSHSWDNFLEEAKSPLHLQKVTKSCDEIDTKYVNFDKNSSGNVNSGNFFEETKPPADLKLYKVLDTRSHSLNDFPKEAKLLPDENNKRLDDEIETKSEKSDGSASDSSEKKVANVKRNFVDRCVNKVRSFIRK